MEFCQGESITLCADSSYVSCLWNTGSTTPCIEVFESGDYWVMCLDSLGNIDSLNVDSSITVVVHDPQPTLYQIDFTVFLGEPWESYQWFFNGESIIWATDSSFTPNESGNYYALITDSFGCIASTDTFECQIHGGCGVPMDIGEQKEFELNLFPNPANDLMILDIAVQKTDQMELLIMDILGRPVHQQILKQVKKSITVDVIKWPNGIYLVSLGNENGKRHTERIVVQH